MNTVPFLLKENGKGIFIENLKLPSVPSATETFRTSMCAGLGGEIGV